MYHAEEDQEAFLVLAGEALLLVEGEERPLRAWDFFHCPPWTEHVIVGAGDGPCVFVAVGARTPGSKVVYPRVDVALRHGAGVEEETDSGAVAYADISEPQARPYREGDLPGW
jgi:oxalate decarboxylase/phosphoglucose isomerase-like protein (cupin superfamily)